MTSLLELPRELRDEIIRLVLLTPRSLPQTAERKVRNDPYGLLFAHRIHYLLLDDTYRPITLGLMLTCHQLYSETRQVSAKINMIPTVDLAIINECWLWPTWRVIPTSTQSCLEQLNVNLRLCCTSEDRLLQTGFGQRHAQHTGTGSLDPIDYLLCGFLGQFLSLASCADTNSTMQKGIMRRSRDDKATFRIKFLQFNIQTDSPKNEQVPYERIPGRIILGLRHLVFDPLYAVDLAASCELEQYLYDTFLVHLPQTFIVRELDALYNRFDIVKFCIDGAKIHEVDISQTRRPGA